MKDRSEETKVLSAKMIYIHRCFGPCKVSFLSFVFRLSPLIRRSALPLLSSTAHLETGPSHVRPANNLSIIMIRRLEHIMPYSLPGAGARPLKGATTVTEAVIRLTRIQKLLGRNPLLFGHLQMSMIGSPTSSDIRVSDVIMLKLAETGSILHSCPWSQPSSPLQRGDHLPLIPQPGRSMVASDDCRLGEAFT
ncbi:hypothetical protein BJX63DRAFT_348700 [Aspergillus granulosus]|uniref:Uncharacterized protein n=1 Tax=Aspergillus granulosus TaxID=176169 RepID=A0ABR4H2T0_9EURO